MSFCLDDGSELLFGPKSFEVPPLSGSGSEPGAVATGFLYGDEPQTAIKSVSPGSAGGLTGMTDVSQLKTAILQPPATAAGSDSKERQSFSANRAAQPRGKVGSRQLQLAAVGVIALLLVGGIFGYRYFAASDPNQIGSIAVMPFVNESGNADFEYLADGMTETLISKLSKVPNLNVKARASVFRYKKIEADPRKVGSELGVHAILNGRVSQIGDQLSMTVELIDTETENVLWSDQYVRKSSDLLALQTEIARDAVAQLHARLSGTDAQNLARNYTADPKAHDLYLKGRYYWNRRTLQDVTSSLAYFQQAVDTDPNYALAYVGLSDAHLMLGIIDAMSGASSPADTIPPALAAAEKAIALDPSLAEAYASRGHARDKDRDFAGAEADFKRSIELNPNYPPVRLFYAISMAFNGLADESIAESKRAVELDPYSVPTVSGQAMIYHLARRDDEALAIARRAVDIDPSFAIGHQRLGEICLSKGMYAEAISSLEKAIELGKRGQLAVASLARAYAAAGDRANALKLLKELEASPRGQYMSSYQLAQIYLTLGDRARSLDLLEKAFAERSVDMLSIKVEPSLDPLRNEPRFQDVVRKIGFP